MGSGDIEHDVAGTQDFRRVVGSGWNFPTARSTLRVDARRDQRPGSKRPSALLAALAPDEDRVP